MNGSQFYSRVLAVCLANLGLALSAQETRLSNVAIRAQAGGTDTLVTGFTIGIGGPKTVLIRAIGPTLGAFGVPGALADPKLELFSGATKIAENDDFAAADAAAFALVGAFQLPPGAKDATLVTTLPPGGYTAQVSGVGGSRGVALVEVYEVGMTGPRLINLSSRAQVGIGGDILIPGITIAPGTGSRKLLIRAIGPTLGTFGVPGVLPDPKLELFSGTSKIAENDDWETAAGNAASTAAQLSASFGQAGAFALASGTKDAAILSNLAPGSYTLQISGANSTTGEALVEVYDLSNASTVEIKPNSGLYFSALRPGTNSASSLASGYAAVTFGSDGTAIVNVSFSNLSSGQTATYLRVAGTNDYLLKLPAGQISELRWTIDPVGVYSRNDIIKAFNEGRIYVSLDTAKFPAGELTGTLASIVGSQSFVAPPAPTPLPPQLLSAPSDVDAARLLMQATFGPTSASIAEVKQLGIPAWISRQINLPASSLLAGIRSDALQFPNPLTSPGGAAFRRIEHYNHTFAWWKLALTAPDQLRQRVALALSEILVVGIQSGGSDEQLAQYYDILVNGSFGTYRQLLERVTLNPEMARSLTYLRNQKADPIKGTSPDENYAREIQQLFTVGLVQLQPDGTLLLDSLGQPIPTYDNVTITETAKVFTGWSYVTLRDNFFADPAFDGSPGGFSFSSFFSDTNGTLLPLKCYESYHDTTQKRVLSLTQDGPRRASPTMIPANQTGAQDLKLLLDTLVDHPNTGPFVCRQLIQRLVTSNPSPGYVYRVAKIFADNGRGVRGDLGAVVTALLLDPEARLPAVIGYVGYGKIKEPLIRLTGLLRALKTSAPNGRFADSYFLDPRAGDNFSPSGFFSNFQNALSTMGQSAQRSASVFNFFSTYYTEPGRLADSGLVAPELQIVDSTLAIKTPNAITNFIHKEPPVLANAPTPSPFLRNDYSELLSLSQSTSELLERVNLLLCAGQMAPAAKTVILEELENVLPVQSLESTGSPAAFALRSNSRAAPLVAPKTGVLAPSGPFTIEGWVHPGRRNYPIGSWIMGKTLPVAAEPWHYFGLVFNADSKINFILSTGINGRVTGALSPNPIVNGQWTHIAGVFDGALLRLFINGRQVAQTPALASPPVDAETPFSIGAGIRKDGNINTARFEGCLSQIRFWNVARTELQIAKAMREKFPTERDGLVAGWLLDEGAGDTAADYSGNLLSLQNASPSSGGVLWAPANGQSLERVQTALHLTVVSADSALQR